MKSLVVKSRESVLFHKPGFVPLKAWLEDVRSMRKSGPWKLPMSMGDRVQMFFLGIIEKFSWLSDSLFISNPADVSPAYSLLVTYLHKQGIFDSFIERDTGYSGYFQYLFEKDMKKGNGVGAAIVRGQCSGKDPATALSKAIGEIIERTVTGLYDRNTMLRSASPEKMMENDVPIVYPPRYHHFLDIQKKKFPELNHDRKKPILWVEGDNMVTRKKTYIPQRMTSWASRERHESMLVHATTNGSAGYFTRSGAVLRGLLEIVQRDGFLVHWLTMIPPQIIRNDTLPEAAQEMIRKFEARGISVSVLNTTALLIPSVVAIGISTQAEIPQIVLSGGADTTFEGAIQSALDEMVMSIGMIHTEKSDTDRVFGKSDFEPFVSYLGKIERQLYWCGAEKVDRFKWFLSGEKTSYQEACDFDVDCPRDDTSRLRGCLKKLRYLGHDYYPIVYYPTNPIQQSLGFFVAQVFIPKAFPLYLFEGYGTFESERLQEFARSRGVADWKLNPLPHGFP